MREPSRRQVTDCSHSHCHVEWQTTRHPLSLSQWCVASLTAGTCLIFSAGISLKNPNCITWENDSHIFHGSKGVDSLLLPSNIDPTLTTCSHLTGHMCGALLSYVECLYSHFLERYNNFSIDTVRDVLLYFLSTLPQAFMTRLCNMFFFSISMFISRFEMKWRYHICIWNVKRKPQPMKCRSFDRDWVSE